MVDYSFFIHFFSSLHLLLCPTISISFASKQFQISYHISLAIFESSYEILIMHLLPDVVVTSRDVFRWLPTVISRFPFWVTTHLDLPFLYMWFSYILSLQFRFFQGLPPCNFFSLLIIISLNTLCTLLSKSKLIWRVLYGLRNSAISRRDEELWVRFAGISHSSQVI